MIITTELIANFNPCGPRFDNFKQQYPNYSNDVSDFITLDKITYSDKIWVLVRFMNISQRVKFAIKCAESALPVFEEKFPDDKRPRKCVEHLKTYDSFESLTQDQINKIRKVRSAADAAAAYAAYAAYYTAYATAYAASAAADDDAAAYAAYAASAAAYAAYAAYYTAYATADAAANTAAYSAYYADAADAAADADTKKQREVILNFALEILQ